MTDAPPLLPDGGVLNFVLRLYFKNVSQTVYITCHPQAGSELSGGWNLQPAGPHSCKYWLPGRAELEFLPRIVVERAAQLLLETLPRGDSVVIPRLDDYKPSYVTLCTLCGDGFEQLDLGPNDQPIAHCFECSVLLQLSTMPKILIGDPEERSARAQKLENLALRAMDLARELGA